MTCGLLINQSGQSLIEHSYKADSDLSTAGWEYAERLKAAVTARRKAVRAEKRRKSEAGAEGDENPLIVSFGCWTPLQQDLVGISKEIG